MQYTVEVDANIWMALEAENEQEARNAARDRINEECFGGGHGWDFEYDRTIALGVGDIDEHRIIKDSSIRVYTYQDTDRVSFPDDEDDEEAEAAAADSDRSE